MSSAAARLAGKIMRVLNVAEKNDAAKRIAGLLSNGTAKTTTGQSVYNKIYEFVYRWPMNNQQVQMAITSVSGHVIGAAFPTTYKYWQSVNPVELFEAPVEKICPEGSVDTMRNLEHQAAYAQVSAKLVLVIWTDGDREGENIGFEIINICKAINPRLQVFRAKFSEITPVAITRAVNNLVQPNKRISDAVDVRIELDLRIGAAFTRFQTLRLQKKFPATLAYHVVSYGSCQFPTLGFVVERYKAIQEFVPEDFWKIHVTHNYEGQMVEFSWARVRLFNQLACQTLLEKCIDNPLATVIKVTSKPKSKWRPVALDTVEFEKLASRKLKISAKEAMTIAEKLYTQGIISYPRTETNIFPNGLHLGPLIEAQAVNDAPWGNFAQRLAQTRPNPRNGKKSDQAHPPIHPTRYANNLGGNEKRVYELIVRHFLACCSKDAVGQETTVDIDIAEEKFVANGLTVLERNYLEVYVYDKWSDKEIPNYRQGQTFRPTSIDMNESHTTPPPLLTEADLIALMEKHGIGTDATHAEHIEKIKSRMYVGVEGDRFVPGQLGMGLVEGYDAMGFQMSKPNLRAELEADLVKVIDGVKAPDVVLREQISRYKAVFLAAVDQVNKLDEAVGQYIAHTNGNNQGPPPPGGNNGRGGGGNNGGGRGNNSDDDDNDDNNRPGGGGGRDDRGPTDSEDGAGRLAPLCGCRIPSIQLVTRKAGNNMGRKFYSCQDKVCGFFKWYDEAHPEEPWNGPAQEQVPQQSQPVPRTQNPSRPPSNYNQPQPTYPTNMPPPRAAPGQNSRGMSGRGRTGATSGRSNQNVPTCGCGVPTVLLTTKKQNDNFGRRFYKCQESVCNYFKWYDEIHPDEPWNGPNTQNQSSSRPGADTSWRGSAPARRAPLASRPQGQGQAGFFRQTTLTPNPAKRARKCGLCHMEGHTRTRCPQRADFGDEDDQEFLTLNY